MKDRRHIFILLLILIAASILRFWNFQGRYSMEADSSRDAIVSFESARLLQLPLTGSFSSIGPITFGPWYYWIITFANFLIPSYWAPWMIMGLASVIFTFVMYEVGVLVEDKNFGLLLALLSAFSPQQISSSSTLTQHSLIGLLSGLIILLFLLINKSKNNSKLVILWGFFLGIAINIHFQTLGLLSLPFIYFFYTKKKSFIFYLFLGLFISMIPMLFFELNNHWFNSRNIVDYIQHGQYRIWTSNRWLTFIGKFIPDFWSYVIGIPYIISLILIISAGIVFSIKFIRKELSVSLIIIMMSFILQIIALRYYRGEKFIGYLQFFHPYVFLITGYMIYLLFQIFKNNSFIIAFGLILYLYLVLPNSLKALSPNQLNLTTFKRFQTLKKEYPKSKFTTYRCFEEDLDNMQALILILYMNNIYDKSGLKISIIHQKCDSVSGNKTLDNKLVDINTRSDDQLIKLGLHPWSPSDVYNGTARWWFKEQP